MEILKSPPYLVSAIILALELPLLIRDYIDQRLTPQLQSYGLHGVPLDVVSADICRRLTSLIGRWTDTAFRRAVLTLGVEEATFYEPQDVNLETRALAVLAVRNSLLEDVCSTAAAALAYGFPQPLKLDPKMRQLTGGAIEWFSRTSLSSLAAAAGSPPNQQDPFASLPVQYPAAWAALASISNGVVYKREYTPVKAASEFPLIAASNDAPLQTRSTKADVQSGMDPRFSPVLLETLQHIQSGDTNFFFSDSFKMITRHPRKLLELIEFVLAHDGLVVTQNYFIRNGYVSRRRELSCPAHTDREMKKKFQYLDGVRGVHRTSLEKVALALSS